MKIYQLESYSVTDNTDDEKLLSMTYHSNQKSIQEQVRINGTEDADFCVIRHKVEELNLKGKKDVINALNNLGESYRIY